MCVSGSVPGSGTYWFLQIACVLYIRYTQSAIISSKLEKEFARLRGALSSTGQTPCSERSGNAFQGSVFGTFLIPGKLSPELGGVEQTPLMVTLHAG